MKWNEIKKKIMYALKILLLSLIIFSCKKQNPVDKIQELILTDSIPVYMGLPTSMKLYDEKLFVVDMFDQNSLVKVIDLPTKELLYSLGCKGEGPTEYLHINDVDWYKGEDGKMKMSLYDPVSSKIGIYDYDSLLSIKSSYVPFMRHFSCEGIRLHELWKIKGGYVSTGSMTEGKYALLSDSLKLLGFYGAYRPKPLRGVSDALHVVANYGKTVFNEDKDFLVEIIYNASVLSCYSIKGKQIKKKWEHVIHDLDYTLVDGSIVNKAPMGYLSASIGSEYVYALYSGEPDREDEIASYGKEIHVYDSAGRIVTKYIISRPSFALCVDECNSKVYVLVHTPEPNILVYDLPD